MCPSPGLTSSTTPHRARAHVFVDDVDVPRLSEPDAKHLHRVLRLRPGDEITASDGAGRWRACRLGAADVLELEATGEVVSEPRPEPRVTVGFALVKGQRPELVVQKLTELGVDRIVPFAAERSVVQWDPDKAARHDARFRVIAREAAMQSRRAHIPEVVPLADFAAVAALPGAALADRDGDPPSLSLPTVLVGPEGGWSGTERTSGVPSVRLGVHTLRSETAAITAGAVLLALRSHLVEQVVSAQVDSPHGP